MIKEIAYSEFVEEVPVTRVLINERGEEVLSNKPVSIPLNIAPPASSMAQLVHQLYAQMRAESQEVETFADADDFDVPDELGIEMRNTPYELDFDHVGEGTAASASSSPVSEVPSPEKVEKVENPA